MIEDTLLQLLNHVPKKSLRDFYSSGAAKELIKVIVNNCDTDGIDLLLQNPDFSRFSPFDLAENPNLTDKQYLFLLQQTITFIKNTKDNDYHLKVMFNVMGPRALSITDKSILSETLSEPYIMPYPALNSLAEEWHGNNFLEELVHHQKDLTDWRIIRSTWLCVPKFKDKIVDLFFKHPDYSNCFFFAGYETDFLSLEDIIKIASNHENKMFLKKAYLFQNTPEDLLYKSFETYCTNNNFRVSNFFQHPNCSIRIFEEAFTNLLTISDFHGYLNELKRTPGYLAMKDFVMTQLCEKKLFSKLSYSVLIDFFEDKTLVDNCLSAEKLAL